MTQRILEGAWESSPGTDYFSIPVFFVLLRETVEVVLIVAVTFAYLSDNKLIEFKRWAIAGVVLGSILDIIIGAILVAVFVTIKSNAFDEASNSEKVFEGTLMLFSCLLITFFGLGMAKMFNNINAKIGRKIAHISSSINAATGPKKVPISPGVFSSTGVISSPKSNEGVDMQDIESDIQDFTEDSTQDITPPMDSTMDAAARSKIAWGVLSVTFFAVVREGLECIVFLAGLTSSYPPQSMPIPAICGVLTGCCVGLLFYRGGRQMGIRFFAIISMAMIFLVAAGLIARSFTEFVELGLDGGPIVYDASECCSTSTPFWGFLRIIFGYNDEPTLAEFLIYFAYWIALIIVGQYMGVWESFRTPPPAVEVEDEVEKELKNSEIITETRVAVA